MRALASRYAASFRLPAPSDDGLTTVILVQAGKGGHILGVGEPKGSKTPASKAQAPKTQP